MSDSGESVRLDKWLWAARVFKTRSIAATACDGGKVDVNDQSAKPAKAPDNVVRVTLPQGRRRILKVNALGDRRGSSQGKAGFPGPRQAATERRSGFNVPYALDGCQ